MSKKLKPTIKVEFCKYDMDKTTNRKRKDFLVYGKNEKDVINQLERIHKGEKVVTIHEIKWAPDQPADAPRSNETYSGEVKFFDPIKGFGFIAPDEEIDDLFFHGTAAGKTEIKSFDVVEFEIGFGPKGPCAIHIKIIDN